MIELSNSLADLAERVKAANGASVAAEKTFFEKALEAGRLLCDAKDGCVHGEWSAFLARADVHDRQARRLMQLARSGLKADTVSDLGGVKAALQYLSTRQLPAEGEYLVVSLDEFKPNKDGSTWVEPIAIVVPATDRNQFLLMMIPWEENQEAIFTKLPVTAKEIKLSDGRVVNPVWETLDHMMDFRAADLSFAIVKDRVPGDVLSLFDELVAKWHHENQAVQQ